MNQTKFDTVAHYLRMMWWAINEGEDEKKCCDPIFDGFSVKMLKAIGENFFSTSCPYCIKYRERCESCELSPLDDDKYRVSAYCCDGWWKDMAGQSNIVNRWLRQAHNVLSYIIEYGGDDE